jgi:hypothetical protein
MIRLTIYLTLYKPSLSPHLPLNKGASEETFPRVGKPRVDEQGRQRVAAHRRHAR